MNCHVRFVSKSIDHLWPAMRKGTIWDKNSISSSNHRSVKSKFPHFLFIYLPEYSSFQLYFDMLSQNICAMSVVIMRRHLFPRRVFLNISLRSLMANFRKLKLWTQVHKLDNNFACGHSFLLKLSPLYSTQKGLSIHTKDSTLMKNPKWSLFI